MAIPSEVLALGARYLDAVVSGNLTLLKSLAEQLDHGEGLSKTFANVVDPDGTNALHLAAVWGHRHICKYLVEDMELNINEKTANGFTPLHHSLKNERYAIARYLIDSGADVTLANLDGHTPLHLAAANGNVEIMELLISRGADIEAISVQDTPLHLAAGCGKADAVKFLLINHANSNSFGHNGITPLLLSIASKSLKCVKFLLKGGADPNLVADGKVPLILATDLDRPDMVMCLKEHGALGSVWILDPDTDVLFEII